MDTPVLTVEDVSKTYSGTTVLHGVSFSLARGEVLGLVGENGAGKSTLLNILSGVTPSDTGTICIRGITGVPRNYHYANRLGVFRVFQEGALIPNLRVFENMLLSHEGPYDWHGLGLDKATMRRIARRMLAAADLTIDVDKRAQDLSLSQRQAVEIARAAGLGSLLGITNPIILLDEPTTALDAESERATMRLIERLKGEASLVFVSHRLPEVLAVSDRVLVLKDGGVVAILSAREASESTLHTLMVGRELSGADGASGGVTSRRKVPNALSVRTMSTERTLVDVSFDLAGGEILGVAGLEGSGKSELGRAIVGDVPLTAGDIDLREERAKPDLRQMMDKGLLYMPGDRQLDGLILGAPIDFNITLPSLHDLLSNKLGIVRTRRSRNLVANGMKTLGIVKRRPSFLCGALSGGQQQRVLFAKYLSRNPQLFILENPTRGVDVQTKTEIYGLLRSLAKDGTGILLISDDLPELMTVADRIMVLAHGRIVDVVAVGESEPSEQELIRLMLQPPLPAQRSSPQKDATPEEGGAARASTSRPLA